MLSDDVVPSGDGKNVTRHHEDENDKQDDNLLSAETKPSIDEKSMSQDVVVHSPQSEISETVKAPDLNDLKHDSNQANPSNSLLAAQQINAPDEKDKQSLSEEVALKAELASEKGIFMEEGSDIKPEDAIAEQNEEAIVEESNVMRDAFESSENLKPSFKYDKNELHITSVASSGKIDLKETASDSSDEMSSESNLTESSQHEKNMSDASLQDEMNCKERKLVEENEKLRQMLEKLVHADQQQMAAINGLIERVKNLEMKLTKRKKLEINRRKKFYNVMSK